MQKAELQLEVEEDNRSAGVRERHAVRKFSIERWNTDGF